MDSYSTFIAPKTIADPTASAKSGEKAKKAAEDFEAMFVTEMIRPMFEAQEPDATFGGGQSEKIYRSMLVDEYGKSIAKAGGIGVAKHVEAELLKLQEVKHSPTMETANAANK